MALDLLIRGGSIVDGSGAARYRGDVAIRDGRIVELGRIRSAAERTIDADGLIVAPGFIDGHTHMDAQVAWDRMGSCSCWHGVTTVIMGNCGFALAPCRPREREWFARCLTAVEDIPTEAMMAGIDWTWETFPEYLATVDRLPKAINYGAYIGHSALRMYVMGKRALAEPATEADLARMAAAGAEGICLGRQGLSDALPAWRQIRRLPLAEQKRRLADPATRRQLVAEEAGMKPRDNVFQGGGAATTDPRKPDYANLFVMKGVDWNDPTVAQLSAQLRRHPVEVMIDLVLENDDQVFVQPLVNEDPEHVLGMLRHARTLATFSDSGAHVCQEMGSSLQTHLLSYWVRQRQAFTLEEAVRKLTFDNASAWEIHDRGLVRTGYRADLVVFDERRVRPAMPTVQTDLPGGARRPVQKAEGIAATVVNGQVTLENGEPTGRTPGGLLHGPGPRSA